MQSQKNRLQNRNLVASDSDGDDNDGDDDDNDDDNHNKDSTAATSKLPELLDVLK